MLRAARWASGLPGGEHSSLGERCWAVALLWRMCNSSRLSPTLRMPVHGSARAHFPTAAKNERPAVGRRSMGRPSGWCGWCTWSSGVPGRWWQADPSGSGWPFVTFLQFPNSKPLPSIGSSGKPAICCWGSQRISSSALTLTLAFLVGLQGLWSLWVLVVV